MLPISTEYRLLKFDCLTNLKAYKTTTILLDGKRVKLQLWDTSGQGRFCTIIRSYSRGAQGIILVYDITNKWSFDGIDRWLKEVDEVRRNEKIMREKLISLISNHCFVLLTLRDRMLM